MPSTSASLFHLVLIKPTQYDDDGYPIQWFRSAIPSNTLASLNGLAEDAQRRKVLGPDVEIRIDTYDETNRRVRPDRMITRDSVQEIEQLPLIFVDPLDLHIEQSAGVDVQPEAIPNNAGQRQFVGALDRGEALLQRGIAGLLGETQERRGVVEDDRAARLA